MNIYQKNVCKCAKNAYRAIKKNDCGCEIRPFNRFYKLFKWALRTSALEEIKQQNEFYKSCVK